jgi:dienelactone hydrolase
MQLHESATRGSERWRLSEMWPTRRTADSANITGVVLVCIGSEDPIVTVDDRAAFEAEMRATEVDWRMQVYGGVEHSFTHPQVDDVGLPGLRYHEPSARRAWRAMLDLFDEVFGDSGPPRHEGLG